MVIRNIITDQAAQVRFIEDNYMVEKLSAADSDPALRDPILPGASVANPLWLNAGGNKKFSYIFAEL